MLYFDPQNLCRIPKTAACMQGICLYPAVWYNLRKKPEWRRAM